MTSPKQSDGHEHTLVPHILAIECALLKVVLRCVSSRERSPPG